MRDMHRNHVIVVWMSAVRMMLPAKVFGHSKTLTSLYVSPLYMAAVRPASIAPEMREDTTTFNGRYIQAGTLKHIVKLN